MCRHEGSRSRWYSSDETWGRNVRHCFKHGSDIAICRGGNGRKESERVPSTVSRKTGYGPILSRSQNMGASAQQIRQTRGQHNEKTVIDTLKGCNLNCNPRSFATQARMSHKISWYLFLQCDAELCNVFKATVVRDVVKCILKKIQRYLSLHFLLQWSASSDWNVYGKNGRQTSQLCGKAIILCCLLSSPPLEWESLSYTF